MITLRYGKLAPLTFTATTAQAGFPANNVGLESLGRPWRAAANGAEDVILSFAAAGAVDSLELHDVNFATATIRKSADGVNYFVVGVLTVYMGKEGRRRGSISIADANVKAVKISIAAGASTDGLAWRIGAGYLFSSVLVVPSPWQFPSHMKWIRPQVRNTLANKQPAVATTGLGFHEISLAFKPWDTEDLQPLLEKVQAGTTVIELGLANYPWQIWPVRYVDDDFDEVFSEPKTSELTLNLTEVV